MREKTNGVSLLVWIMYGVMLILTFILLMISMKKYKVESPIEQLNKESMSFAEGWMDGEGNTVDLLNLNESKKIKAGEECWLFHSIPSEIKEGYTLNIAAKNIYYQLYVDGDLLPDVYNSKEQKVENSFGRKYSMIPIEKSMAGKTIAIKFVLVYDEVSSSFIEIKLGLPQGYLLHFAKQKIIAVVTSILFLFVSILLILVDIPINMNNEKSHELLALGLFSFVVGMWGLTSTHCVEYFTGDGRTTQIAACLFLALIPLPLLIYLRNSMGVFTYKQLFIYTILSFVEFMVVWLLEITEIADVQKTLKITHIMLIICILLVISLLFRKHNNIEKNKVSKTYSLFRMMGLIALLGGTVVDLIRYYQGYVEDNAMFVRFGLLLFIMCLGVASLEKTIRAVKIGAKAEFISQLAYQDGLTNLSNRTAFNERVEQLQMKQDNVGVIMLDVNNLKLVNDNLGHQYGDEMLVKSARMISDSFEPIGGECYRIGGDEFVVILFKENIWERVADGLKAFKGYVNEYNAQENLKYHINIAYGYAILEDEKCNMSQLYEIADYRMYECKKQMKEKGEMNSIIHC